MSIPESVIREMKAFHRDSCYPECGNESASDAARRVILALAEAMPENAVEKAAFSICQSGKFENGEGRCAMICMDSLGNKPKQCVHASRVHGKLARAVIAAFLKHVGETP